MQYAKPALTLDEQIAQIKGRGLTVDDEGRSRRYLSQIGYYRLSPYMIPFQSNDGSHRFRAGVTFDDVLNHYVFDRRLRAIVMDALERFEVALRAAISNHMSLKSGDPFWYLDASRFKISYDHARLLNDLEKEISGERRRLDSDLRRAKDQSAQDSARKQSFLRHYVSTYTKPPQPPSWMMVETLMFGPLMYLYRGLADRADQKAIAQELGLTDELLSSWLGSFLYARNLCAHHHRLWNRQFGAAPAIPKSRTVQWLNDASTFTGAGFYRRQRVYPVIVALQSVLKEISPGSSWAIRLSALFADFPTVPLRPMGFPEAWKDDGFWHSHVP